MGRYSEVVSQYRLGAPANLHPVVNESALSPIAEAARLAAQQMEQGVAIARFAAWHACPGRSFVEERTHFLHRTQQSIVAADPGDVAGPAAAFDVESTIIFVQLLDHR